MSRFTLAGALTLALALIGSGVAESAAAAHHEPVVQVVTVQVKPGKLEQYRQEVKKLRGVMERLGSKATLRMWNATAAGPDTGNVLVGVEYPDAAAWAADSTRVAGDPEWQSVVSGLDALRTVVSNSIWRDVSSTPGTAGSGGVLLLTGVDVKPGKLDAYRKKLDGVSAIAERLGISGNLRIWHAELAGPATGAVAVGIEYDDLAQYVASQAKLAADAEWKSLLAELDALRTLTGRWIYQEITP